MTLPDGFLTPDWALPAGVRAAVSTRELPGRSRGAFAGCNFGTRCGDDPAAVTWNRTALCRWLELPREPLWLRQVHGTTVVDGDALASEPESGVEGDAAVVRRSGAALAILTADCLPVLFCADDGSAIGAAHAGWRGLAGGVLESSVRSLGTDPAALGVWIGPGIGAASYEVGAEVRQAFLNAQPGAAAAFRASRPDHWLCDLALLAHQRLAALGIAKIHGGGFDTFRDPRFYSYRRESPTGRFASLIWRVP